MRFSQFSLFAALVIVAGCGGPGDRVEITDTQERSEHRYPVKPDATNAERFQFSPSAQQFGMASMPNEGGEIGFHSETPEGWTELPSSEFRQINLAFGPNNEGECYVSILPGGGGGILENINRWKDQMNLEPMTEDEFSVLQKYEILGEPAVYVDFEGAYEGMGTSEVKENYRMTGVLLKYQGAGVFIKMVGPTELVQENRSKFEQFVASLHSSAGHSHADEHAHDHEPVDAEPVAAAPTMGSASDLPPGHPPVDDAMVMAQAQGDQEGAPEAGDDGQSGAQGFTWSVPEGWVKAPDRTMRLVTYNLEGDENTECYISILGGQAGGLGPNVNRWIAQFGGEPLTDEQMDALPKIDMLGKEVPLVEAEGDFTTMRGEQLQDQALLGTAWISDEVSLFVKMTGPKEEVQGQKDEFTAFCESLKRE